MKKLFALIALIFTVGMMVDFRPEETPPDIQLIETLDQDYYQEIEALPVYQVKGISREVFRIDDSPTLVEDMTYQIDGGNLIPNQVKKTPNPDQRLDKEFDPGRCSMI